MSEVRFPQNGADQLKNLGPRNIYAALTHELLHEPLLSLMDEQGLDMVASSCRTKSLKRLGEKLHRTDWKLVADIHAVRLVLKRNDFYQARDAIFSKWPTPEFIYPGLPSFRDYGGKGVRAEFNESSDPGYKAAHINIHVPFGARIAEIQLYTVQDYLFYMRTKDQYVARQRGL